MLEIAGLICIRLIKELRVADPGSSVWALMRIHHVASDVIFDLWYSSKLLAQWAFFCLLRDQRGRAASAFIEAHMAEVGVQSTLDVDACLEGI